MTTLTHDTTMTETIQAAPAASPAPVALLAALVAARAAIANPTKSAKNTHFGSRYATLEDVIEAVTPSLAAHGLVLTQRVSGGGTGQPYVLTTTLWHQSGECLTDTVVLNYDKNTPQAVSSSVTYWRRVAIKSLLCLAEADDDGEAASGRGPNTAPARATKTSAVDVRSRGDSREPLSQLTGVVEPEVEPAKPKQPPEGSVAAKAAEHGEVEISSVELEAMMREANSEAALNAIAAKAKGRVTPEERKLLAKVYNECMAALTEVGS